MSPEGDPAVLLADSMCLRPAGLSGPQRQHHCPGRRAGPGPLPQAAVAICPRLGRLRARAGMGRGAGVRGASAPGPGRAEDVEVLRGMLPGLGKERLDPLHLLLLLLQLLGAQGGIGLQVNVPFGDEHFVGRGELRRDLGHHLHSTPASPPPGLLPLRPPGLRSPPY